MNFGVVLIILSAAVRWLRIGKFSDSSPIDLPLLFFLVSALVAYWAAPDRTAALARLYLLLSATGVYYTLSNSNPRSLKWFANAFVVMSAVAGIFFASQNDWREIPARFEAVGNLGLWLNQLIPNFELSLPRWYVIRNILASNLMLAAPVALVTVSQSVKRVWKIRDKTIAQMIVGCIEIMMAFLGGLAILFGLIMTESRTPWIAAGIVIGLSLWWWLSNLIRRKLDLSHIVIFGTGLVIVASIVGYMFWIQPKLLKLFSLIPGPDTATGREEIFSQSWRLAQDTPFTGGGLAAFPALYSTYIRVIPHNAFLNEDTGNNAYLNILVEQGWLGAISFLSLLLVAIWAATKRIGSPDNPKSELLVAGTFGLILVCLHGLAHATLVATRAIPFMLIPAALALSNPSKTEKIAPICPSHRWRLVVIIIFFVAILFLLVGVVSTPTWSADWHANIGAIEMARVDLAEWPVGTWDVAYNLAELGSAESFYKRSLMLAPNNRTAHHRLGLIAMLQRDFATAVSHLEQAFVLDPGHRGIRKSLGYSYVWAGQMDRASVLLDGIPEARDEMEVYIWWWGTQGRSDLAAHAEEMANRIN